MNLDYYHGLKEFFNNTNRGDIDPEMYRYVQKQIEDLERFGINLKNEAKEVLLDIDQEINRL